MIQIIAIVLILLTQEIMAAENLYSEENPINTTTELKSWCKNKSSEFFLAKGQTPYNWTDSWRTEGEFFFVKGKWKVDSKEYIINCRVRRGVAEKYATWEFVKE